MPKEATSGLSLTQATKVSRAALIYGAGGLVAFLVLWFAGGAFIRYWVATHPAPPPPPTVGFGVLPAQAFPQNTTTEKPSQYVLETATGRLPEFPDRAIVYFMPKNAPSLLDAEAASQFAAKYDFVFKPEILNDREYRWQKTQPILTTLEYDIQDHVFSFESDFFNHPELLLNAELPTKFDAIAEVKKFLAKGVSLKPDIATASGSFAFMKSVGSDLVPAVSVADADFISVDLNRVPVAGTYEMYTDKDGRGVIHALVGNLKDTEKILSIDYYYYPIDQSVSHTYPLRPVKQAWELLQGGEAFVSHAIGNKQATIREVTLGYYDSTQPQTYLQPIYVFSGDDDFRAFVPAIEPTYINSAVSTP